MAKATHEKEKLKENEVVEQPKHALATVDESMYAADAGSGMEGATAESFAIPFVIVLQKTSPQVDEATGQAIDGARAGMIYENVTNRLFDGVKEGVPFIPCAYRRVYLRWGARKLGGGFKGELTPEAVAQMRANGQVKELDGKLFVPLEGGVVDPDKCDYIGDFRNHYILLVDPKENIWTQAVLSLTSTQIKKSKMLMSMLASIKIRNRDGVPFTPPTFANIVKMTTIGESNEKGSWFGVRFEAAGRVSDASLYAAAKAFNETVQKGAVEVKYEDTGDSHGEAPTPGDKF